MSKFIPNSFQIPNAFVDEVMFALSGNAVKAYLLVARKTTGWQKESDFISIEQFKQFTGINRDKTIYEILKELEEVGLIRTVKAAGRTTEFYLVKDLPNVENKPVAKSATSGEKRHQLQKTPPVAKNATTVVAESATATSGEKRHPTKTNNKTNINNPPIVPPAEQVVLDYLNLALVDLAEQRGERKPSGFKLTDKTKSVIGARLAEFDLDVCKRVVDYLVTKWGHDPEMQDYLRPSTIFRPNNFAEYAVMSEGWDSRGRPQMRNGQWVLADGTILQGRKSTAPNPASKSTAWAQGRKIQIRNPEVAEKLRKAGVIR